MLIFLYKDWLCSNGKKAIAKITKIVKFILVPIHIPKNITANSKYFLEKENNPSEKKSNAHE